MKSFQYVLLGLVITLGLFITFITLTIGFVVGSLNQEVTLRNSVKAQSDVQQAAYDKLWRKIAQETQITKASTATQEKLIESLVSGRQASFIKFVQEQNPTTIFNQEQFNRLSNTVASERDGLFREQKVLVSKVQIYNNLMESTIAGTVLAMAGRHKMEEPKLITSEKAAQASATGRDEDVKLELK